VEPCVLQGGPEMHGGVRGNGQGATASGALYKNI